LSEAKRTSCCCTCSATPRKSPIFCDPEAKLGKRNSGRETREEKLGKRNSGRETREEKLGRRNSAGIANFIYISNR